MWNIPFTELYKYVPGMYVNVIMLILNIIIIIRKYYERHVMHRDDCINYK